MCITRVNRNMFFIIFNFFKKLKLFFHKNAFLRKSEKTPIFGLLPKKGQKTNLDFVTAVDPRIGPRLIIKTGIKKWSIGGAPDFRFFGLFRDCAVFAKVRVFNSIKNGFVKFITFNSRENLKSIRK